MQYDPGSGGADNHRSQYRGMQVAQYFFEREQNGCDGRVEGGCQCGRTSHRDQRLDALFTEAESPAQYGSDSSADLDRGSFAAEGDAAGERCGAAEELSENGAQRDVAVVDEDGKLGLRDAAAAGIRKIAEEKKSADEGADDGNHHPAPGRAAGRVHLCG